MTEPAAEHGQEGWRAYALPISADGLEIVASQFLVTQRRVGLLPWVALSVGTAANLAANIAVGGRDLIGRVVSSPPWVDSEEAIRRNGLRACARRTTLTATLN